jgi:hypothetical protein
MSAPIACPSTGLVQNELVPCAGRDCQLWITPYTTENRLMQEGGCSLELAPMMEAGLFRV